MSACELLTHCHPLRAWRVSQIAVLERALQACLHDWVEAWSIGGREGEVRCDPAAEQDDALAWRALGTRHGAAAWTAEPADLDARIAFALFATPQADTPVVRRVCAACMQDLRHRLVAALQLAASGSYDPSAINKRTPMGRMGTEDEVAEGIAFLLTPAGASYITGHTLEVNGGWTAYGFI